MNAYERCKQLGGKVKVITDSDTGKKMNVCSGATSKDRKGKILYWGPVSGGFVVKKNASKRNKN